MGEIVTTPKNIAITPPTDQVNKDHIRFYWDAVSPYADVRYMIQDSAGKVLSTEFVKLQPLTDYFTSATLLEIKNVAEAQIWADIQSKYTVEDK